MKRFKNVELAEMYKVSEKSIRNWIEAAKEKKLNLQLIKEDDKAYIANTPTNHLVLKKLAEKGHKYKNRRSLKIIHPKPEFYKIFNERQIIDLIKNIEVHKEIPMKYVYINGGATSWDEYALRVWKSGELNPITNTIELLRLNEEYIFSLISKYKKINIVDIGPGNCISIKEFLEKIIKRDLLKKYIAIDYSPDMIKIAQKNLKSWFGNKLEFESYQIDITKDNLQEILFTNAQDISSAKETLNLVFFFGSTIENDRLYDQPLRIIANSMGINDILITEQRLDSPTSRLKLTFGSPEQVVTNTDLAHRLLVPNLLNILPGYYDIERVYNEDVNARLISIVLKSDLKIKISTEHLNKELNLSNRDKIIFWRHNHHNSLSIINELYKSGFKMLHSSTSMDRDDIMIISKIDTQ